MTTRCLPFPSLSPSPPSSLSLHPHPPPSSRRPFGSSAPRHQHQHHLALSRRSSARYTGFHYVDWVYDGGDIVYAVRAGYRGSNTYHNANRLAVKRLSDYAGACAPWQDRYRAVGAGWCRPVSGYVPAGIGLSARDCAQACTASASCAGFANGANKSTSHAVQSCAMYPSTPTSSSKTGDFTCYAKR